MTPHYGADYLVAYQRIQQIGGVIQMPRGNKRRIPQSSPQKTTTSTCEDKRMQRCPARCLTDRGGAPPSMNPDRMFLIANAPELNGQENIWQFMRQNWISNR